MGKASCCCCDLPQAQCDLITELWLQLRTSLVFICENCTPLPKHKTSGNALSSSPALTSIQREPNPGTAQPCVSPLAAGTPTNTLCLQQETGAHGTRCVCAHAGHRAAPAPAHPLLHPGFALMAPPRRGLSTVSL